jgi:DNA-binding MarR family transcriptional regulator
MSDREQPATHHTGDHDPTACARAWQTLRMAHDRVAERLSTELAESCGLVLNEFDALLYLRMHPEEPVRIGALRQAVSLSQPALSRLVARLESRGLLTRSEATDDARSSLVGLTPAGTALIDRAIEIHARTVHEALTGKITAVEQAELLKVLSRITV